MRYGSSLSLRNAVRLARVPSAAITSGNEATVCWAKQVAERSGGVLGRSHGGTITNTAIVIVPQRASGTHHTHHEPPSQSIILLIVTA